MLMVALLSVHADTLAVLAASQVVAELERKTDKFNEEKLLGFQT